MARGMSRDIQIQLDALQQLAGFARHGSRELLEQATKEGRRVAIRAIGKSLALTDSYIGRHLRVTRPVQKGAVWEASVQATRRGTLLTRFPHRQLRKPNRTKPGTKHAGITGTVVPGRSYTQRKFFYIPKLRRSNATGIAVRTGDGRDDYLVIHAPSVSQAFQQHRGDLSEGLMRTLTFRYTQKIRSIYSKTAGADPETIFLR